MRSDDSGFVSGKSLILLRPKQREETDSTLSALTVKPDGLVKIVVQRVRKSSPQNFVYDASGWPGEATIVLKITSSGGDSARDLRQDVELRRGPLVNEPDCIVPVLALFQSSADSKKRILIAVYKCGGEGLETWQDLNEDARCVIPAFPLNSVIGPSNLVLISCYALQSAASVDSCSPSPRPPRRTRRFRRSQCRRRLGRTRSPH